MIGRSGDIAVDCRAGMAVGEGPSAEKRRQRRPLALVQFADAYFRTADKREFVPFD